MKKLNNFFLWLCHIDLCNGRFYSERLISYFCDFPLQTFVCLAFWLIWEISQNARER